MALLKQENVPLAEGKVLIPAVKKPHLVHLTHFSDGRSPALYRARP